MGTESVGWAVTDRDYNLVKQRGNDFWGVYLSTRLIPQRKGELSAREEDVLQGQGIVLCFCRSCSTVK